MTAKPTLCIWYHPYLISTDSVMPVFIDH